jgi:hypothetical protein
MKDRAAQRYYRIDNESIGKVVTLLAISTGISTLITSIYNRAYTFCFQVGKIGICCRKRYDAADVGLQAVGPVEKWT